jgi:hypothetical protein
MNPGQHSTEHAGRRKALMRNEITWGAAGVLIILLLFLLYYALFVYHTDPGYEDNSYHDYVSSVTFINSRAVGWYNRAKENYENLRARWSGNAEITSEVADTLASLNNAVESTTVH